jgi:ureidoglycolate lyase
MRTLSLEPLSAETFMEFGSVIDPAAPCERISINDGRTLRHHDLARVDCIPADAPAGLSLFRATPVDASFVLRRLERHPLGSQAFINTGGHRYAVVVAPPGDLDESRIRAFLAGPRQSINYHRGTWHHYLLALDAPSDFVVVDRLGPGDNCDEQNLITPLRLDLDP